MQLLSLVSQFTRAQVIAAFVQIPSFTALTALAIFESADKKADLYNILWTLVFGFATLNILSLVVKRFEPSNNRMSFGEILAVGTVIVAVFLLGWEMLYLFKVFPIKLSPR